MLHAGLDLSRTRLDYRLLDGDGVRVEVGKALPDWDGLAGFVRRVEERHGRHRPCDSIRRRRCSPSKWLKWRPVI